jgi:hypothetical protein
MTTQDDVAAEWNAALMVARLTREGGGSFWVPTRVTTPEILWARFGNLEPRLSDAGYAEQHEPQERDRRAATRHPGYRLSKQWLVEKPFG